MNSYKYPALRMRQTPTGNWLLFFSAPALEIEQWAGVPQRRQLDNSETTGFQRVVNKKRLKALLEFCNDERNTIQNPLLCATREESDKFFKFKPLNIEDDSANEAQLGVLEIISEDLESLSLLEILLRVKEYLLTRVPSLRRAQAS